MNYWRICSSSFWLLRDKRCADMFDTKLKLSSNLSGQIHISRATQTCFRFVPYAVLYYKPIKSHTNVFQGCSICCFIFQTYQEPHKRVSCLFHMLFYISNLSRATQTCFRFDSCYSFQSKIWRPLYFSSKQNMLIHIQRLH